jgi:hypothetical protein
MCTASRAQSGYYGWAAEQFVVWLMRVLVNVRRDQCRKTSNRDRHDKTMVRRQPFSKWRPRAFTLWTSFNYSLMPLRRQERILAQ